MSILAANPNLFFLRVRFPRMDIFWARVLLLRKLSMDFVNELLSGVMRLYRSFEKPNAMGHAVFRNPRVPQIPLKIEGHANVSGCIILLNRLVASVVARTGLPKIGNPVIGPVAINMVNLVLRPCAIEIQPCQTVRRVASAPLNLNVDVSCDFGRKSSDVARVPSIPPFGMSRPHSPSENAGFWIVFQDRAQKICRQIGAILLHDLPLTGSKVSLSWLLCGGKSLKRRYK